MDERSARRAGHGGGVQLRLFVGLPVIGEAASRLEAWSEAIAEGRDGVTPIDAGSLHLTFAHLGDVAEEYLPAVAASVQAAASEVTGPTLCSVGMVTTFGSGRVLGVEVDLELLALLAAARDRFVTSVTPWAVNVDRRAWYPHVSLLRSSTDRPLDDALFEVAPEPPAVSWIVPELTLYASLPGPQWRQYRPLHAVPFGAPISSR